MYRFVPGLAAAFVMVVSVSAIRANDVFDSRTPDVIFTDRSGRALSDPLFDALVSPNMTPHVTVFAVSNNGDLPARYTIDVSPPRKIGTASSLAERLVVTVRETASQTIVYDGSLDRLRIRRPQAVQPKHIVGYSVSISWPAAADDDRYQGNAVTVDLVLTAVAA